MKIGKQIEWKACNWSISSNGLYLYVLAVCGPLQRVDEWLREPENKVQFGLTNQMNYHPTQQEL